MTNRVLFGALGVLLISGCPTRTIYYDAGTDAAGGQGAGGRSDAAGDTGLGGAAGASPGGKGGVAGNEGPGGAGGAQGGAAGVAEGVGGGSGQPGAGGAGGASGQAGTAGAGGAAGSTSMKSKDGEHCALASDCASAACMPFYADLDGDGYGAGQAVGFCGATAPIGYAAQSGDCCDTATNLATAKLIHPGADFQTTSAGGICNITWDYDCSGTVETETRKDCSGLPSCETIDKSFSPDQCGMPVGSCACDGVTGPANSPMCSGGCSPAGTLGCK